MDVNACSELKTLNSIMEGVNVILENLDFSITCVECSGLNKASSLSEL